MCGIVGVYEFKKHSCVDNEMLVRMRDTMIHRGPDDADIYITKDRSVGLGHRRLSIVDLTEKGRQPMANDARDMWIVFNGEIYNHLKLRIDLENRGYRYHSGTDTETLLYLYQEYGRDCLKMLEGMFAFAIWDAKKKKLFIARDRLGIKPVYYSLQNNRILFASEVKALLEHPTIIPALNEEALFYFLSFICTPPPHTLFKGIHKLEPGTCMQIGESGLEYKQRWWSSYENNNNKVRTEEEYVDQIRYLLREAADKRMMSDVPFGAFLSGGIDSSLNVAFMTELLDRPVDTFTVGFSTPGSERYNEFSPAKIVAEKFKSNHQEISFDTDMIQAELSGFMKQMDDPVAHPVCIPFYMMCKAAKKAGVTVVQVGEGSDEIFIGYDRFMADIATSDGWKWNTYNKLPSFIKNMIYKNNKYSYENKHNGKFSYFRVDQEYLRRAANNEEIFWGGVMCYPEDVKRQILTEDFLKRNNSLNTYHDIIEPMYKSINREFPEADIAQKMSHIEMQLRLPEHLLARVDKMSMASAVEARVPFLDHKLVELVYNMPREIKLRDGAKSVLKKAARGIIPDDIIDRKKQGFAAPATNWFKSMPEVLERALLKSPIFEAGIFKQEFLKDLVQRSQGNIGWDLHIWSIYVLARWHENWITN